MMKEDGYSRQYSVHVCIHMKAIRTSQFVNGLKRYEKRFVGMLAGGSMSNEAVSGKLC